MLGKSGLADQQIIDGLERSYNLNVTAIEFLPIGYDSHAAVYRIQADGQSYFLKAKYDAIDELSVRIPRYLKAHGLEEVVAPIPTLSGALWSVLDSVTLILYPFIEGTSGWGADLSDEQWRTFGAILKRLHATVLPDDLLSRLPKEDYRLHPKWSEIVKEIHQSVRGRIYENAVERQLARFWIDHYRTIGRIIQSAERLGKMLAAKHLNCVLCHADIHPGNVMLDAGGNLHIVDWDQPIYAPIERDLLFFMVRSFTVGEPEAALFFQGYGNTQFDPMALAYYSYARIVEDLGGFAESVFMMQGDDEIKQDAVNWVTKMFESGDLLEVAQRIESGLFVSED